MPKCYLKAINWKKARVCNFIILKTSKLNLSYDVVCDILSGKTISLPDVIAWINFLFHLDGKNVTPHKMFGSHCAHKRIINRVTLLKALSFDVRLTEILHVWQDQDYPKHACKEFDFQSDVRFHFIDSVSSLNAEWQWCEEEK